MCCRSTAAKATSPSSTPCAAACTWSSEAGTRDRSHEPRYLEAHGLPCWCWTKPTKCCASALSTPSKASSNRRRRSGRWRCSPPPFPPDSPHSVETSAHTRRDHDQEQDSTATNIRQRYWMVSGMHKLDALTRITGRPNPSTHAGIHPYQAGDRRAGRETRGTGLCRRSAQRRHSPPQRERTVARLKPVRSTSCGHRCGRARPGRRPHRLCRELRRPYDTESTCIASAAPAGGRKGEAYCSSPPGNAICSGHRACHKAGDRTHEPCRRSTRSMPCESRNSNSGYRGRTHGCAVLSDPCWSNWRRKPACRSSISPRRWRACRRYDAVAADRQIGRPAEAHSRPSARPACANDRRHGQSSMSASRNAVVPDRPRAADPVPPVEGRASPAPNRPQASWNFSHRSRSVHGIKPGNIVGAIANESGIEVYTSAAWISGRIIARRTCRKACQTDIQGFAEGRGGGP